MPTPHLDQLSAEALPPLRPRLAFFDVDGTLLNNAGELSAATISAVAALRQAGVRTAFATGRPPFAVANLQPRLQLDGPHVFYTGAYSVAPNRTFADHPLPLAQLRPLIDAARARDCYCEIYYRDSFFTAEPTDIACEHARHLGVAPQFAAPQAWPDAPAYKLLLGCDLQRQPSGLVALERAWPEFHFAYAHLPSRPNWQFASVVSGRVDKAGLFTQITDYLALSPAEVIAFGDGGSDCEFLRAAGLGVAMGNASAAVQAAANYVTRSSCQDGVAYALARLACAI